MRQHDVKTKQLAQTVTDFLEPFIPYLLIGSKKAAEEACKKAGPELWELENKLWDKLCSREYPELKEAAGDLVIVPSDSEIKQVLILEIMKSFEKDPDLANEILVFMEDAPVKRKFVFKQGSNDKARVVEEFSRLLEELKVKTSIFHNTKQMEGKTEGKIERQIEEKVERKIEEKIERKIERYIEEKLEKEELMEKTLDFASRIQYGDLRSLALSLTIPHLEGPDRNELIKKALYSVSLIQDEAERAAVLSSLEPHLKGPDREKIIEDILDFAPHIQYDDSKFQVLTLLVRHLEGFGKERLVEKARDMAYGIQSECLRVEALSLLVSNRSE